MDFKEFLDSTSGLAIKGALVAAFLDLAFGVFAAVKDGTFAIDSIAAFVRKHLLGRVFPIGILAVAGHVTGDPIMVAAGATALTAYAAETLGSIYFSVKPPSPSVETEVENPAILGNPVPEE